MQPGRNPDKDDWIFIACLVLLLVVFWLTAMWAVTRWAVG